MNIGIMQSYFFPYIGYFQLIDSVDTFIIYEYVSFRKKSWVTRNRILDKGKDTPIYINVPVFGKSSNKLMKEINIGRDDEWKKKLLKLIHFNYKKAKHYNEIYPFLEDLISTSEDNLHDYNSKAISKICTLLNIKTNIIHENTLGENLELELQRDSEIIESNTKSERIIRLCEKYNATTYVNPIGGVELYDKKYFQERNTGLCFVNTEEYSYQQFGDNFTPHLSIIDMLMHAGVDETKKNIKKYKLI